MNRSTGTRCVHHTCSGRIDTSSPFRRTTPTAGGPVRRSAATRSRATLASRRRGRRAPPAAPNRQARSPRATRRSRLAHRRRRRMRRSQRQVHAGCGRRQPLGVTVAADRVPGEPSGVEADEADPQAAPSAGPKCFRAYRCWLSSSSSDGRGPYARRAPCRCSARPQRSDTNTVRHPRRFALISQSVSS